MGKSKKRYLLIIISAVMAALCAVSALADPIDLATSLKVRMYKKGDGAWTAISSSSTDISVAAGEFPLHILGTYEVSLDGVVHNFMPDYTYTGSFSLRTFDNGDLKDLTQSLSTWSDQFVLTNGYAPTNANYHEVLIPDVCVTTDFPVTSTSSSGQSVYIYTCHFTFRLNSELPYDDLNRIGLHLLLLATDFNSLPSSFGFRGLSINSVTYDLTGDAYMQATLQQIQNLLSNLNAFASQNHVDLTDVIENTENVYTSLEELQEAYWDGLLDFQDYLDEAARIKNQQEIDNAAANRAAEQNAAQNAGNASGSMSAMESAFPTIDFQNALYSLYSGLTNTGTSFSFKFPSSGTVPVLNTVLWPEYDIPLKTWIDNIPNAIKISVRFVFWVGVLGTTWFHLRKLFNLFSGGNV